MNDNYTVHNKYNIQNTNVIVKADDLSSVTIFDAIKEIYDSVSLLTLCTIISKKLKIRLDHIIPIIASHIINKNDDFICD